MQNMEQKFGINSLNLQVLREFCEHEGKVVSYQKGERMECEDEPANWFGFVTEGCFKYTTYLQLIVYQLVLIKTTEK